MIPFTTLYVYTWDGGNNRRSRLCTGQDSGWSAWLIPAKCYGRKRWPRVMRLYCGQHILYYKTYSTSPIGATRRWQATPYAPLEARLA